jgi:hypothetical protein
MERRWLCNGRQRQTAAGAPASVAARRMHIAAPIPLKDAAHRDSLQTGQAFSWGSGLRGRAILVGLAVALTHLRDELLPTQLCLIGQRDACVNAPLSQLRARSGGTPGWGYVIWVVQEPNRDASFFRKHL